MNPIKRATDIGGLVVKGIELGIDIYQAVRKVTTREPVPKPWGRKHHWMEYAGSPAERIEKPYCFHCTTLRTDTNANAMCPGPPGWR